MNAAGLWSREVGRLAGIELPLIPVEHHYLVTDSIDEIEELEFELPQIKRQRNRMLCPPGRAGIVARRL